MVFKRMHAIAVLEFLDIIPDCKMASSELYVFDWFTLIRFLFCEQKIGRLSFLLVLLVLPDGPWWWTGYGSSIKAHVKCLFCLAITSCRRHCCVELHGEGSGKELTAGAAAKHRTSSTLPTSSCLRSWNTLLRIRVNIQGWWTRSPKSFTCAMFDYKAWVSLLEKQLLWRFC
jgi:hypothetical protein